MIYVNGKPMKIERFEDGTQKMMNIALPDICNNEVVFDWRYQSDGELLTLMFLVNHFKDSDVSGRYILKLPYLPYARMDRIKSENEVFTLKWFCKIINSLEFDKVLVLDPHSNVGPALLNKVKACSPAKYITRAIEQIGSENLVAYYPDFGAYKKYKELFKVNPFCYGKKIRDWKTSKVVGLEIENEMNVNLEGKTILMIDDIVAYGDTMFRGANELKKLGADKIYAYVTHTEMAALDESEGKMLKALDSGMIERLFTTDSIFLGEHEKITVYQLTAANGDDWIESDFLRC